MNKKLTKKTISIALSSLLFISPVASPAGGFWGADGFAYGNFTKGAIATDPLTGTQFMSLGSAEIRFKRSSNYAPLFSVGAPSIKVDCRSASFNGGFASLINLEQIGDQLRDAGASLAWGIMIGIAYSMPALKQVFDEINKWANLLSQILAKACDAGQIIGKGIGKALFSDINNHLEVAADAISSARSGLDANDLLGQLEKAIGEGKVTNADYNNLYNALMQLILKSGEESLIASYLNGLHLSNSEPSTAFPFPSADSTSTYGVAISVNKLSEFNLSDGALVSVFILQNLLSGDVAISEHSLEVLEELSGITDNYGAEKDKFMTYAKTAFTKEKYKPTYYLSNSNFSKSANLIKQFLFTGAKGNSAIYKDISAPTFVNVTHKLASGNNQKIILLSAINKEDSDKSNTYAELLSTWKGVVYSSRATIAKAINKKIENFTGSSIPTNQVDTSSLIPIMDPTIYEYLRNYILLEGKNRMFSTSATFLGSDDEPESFRIKVNNNKDLEDKAEKLAAINAYLFVRDLINSMEVTILKTTEKAMKKENAGNGQNSENVEQNTPTQDGDNDGKKKLALIEGVRTKLKSLREDVEKEFKNINEIDYIERTNKLFIEEINKKINNKGR